MSAYGDHLITSGYHDITPEQEREIDNTARFDLLKSALFEELGEAEYKLARWSQGAEPWHYWSREAIETALEAAVAKVGCSITSPKIIGMTYDGVEVLAPAVASENFTTEEVRAAIAKATEEPWIEHNGREMPVGGETLVTVKFRDGATDDVPTLASYWHDENPHASNWRHDGQLQAAAEIVAYRIHMPSPAGAA